MKNYLLPEVSDKDGERIGLTKSQMNDDELQCWESYFVNVIYYILLSTFGQCNKLHITPNEK